MKKSFSIVLLVFLVGSIYSQEKEKQEEKLKVAIYSNLFTAKLTYDTKLSEKWSLQNELAISKAFDHNQFDFAPILLKYNITKKWSFFGGPKLRFSTTKDDLYIDTPLGFNVMGQVGTHYDSSANLFGEVIYENNFMSKGFNQIPTGGHLKFGVGFKF